MLDGPNATVLADGEPALSGIQSSLPLQLTPLVGRLQEIAAACKLLLRPEVRLLTLMGSPGIGKTRLALAVAAALVTAFAQGCYFVSLAALSDAALVPSAIAAALNLREDGELPIFDILKHFLATRQLLLVLDNFEHLNAAGTVISDLLLAAPQLKVLVTSRVLLHLYGEHDLLVPPLSTPFVSRTLAPDEAAGYEALQLFLQRTQAVQPDFRLTADNTPTIARICQQLDGLPLALELAAARMRLLTPTALLTRLDNRLKLLTGGPRNLPAHQQTLRSTIDWSYELLGPAAQNHFRRVAVFAGGFDFDAAEAVVGPGEDLLHSLQELLDSSLLQQAEPAAGQPRLFMLETIREYSLERLAQADEDEVIKTAHARYFLDLAERARDNLTRAEQVVWLDALELEHENLRAALAHYIARKDAAPALRLAGALHRFWFLRGYLTEGRGWLEKTLAVPQAMPSTSEQQARAEALRAFGILARHQGDFSSARRYLEQSLALWRELGDELGAARAAVNLGAIVRYQGDVSTARALLEASIAILQAHDDAWNLALALSFLGAVASSEGHYPAARELLQQSELMFRQQGDRWGLALALNSLGEVARCQQDYPQAARLYQDALTLFKSLQQQWWAAATLYNLGQVALFMDAPQLAASRFVESLRAWIEFSHPVGIAVCLAGMAGVGAQSGATASAASLLSFARMMLQGIGVVLEPADLLAEQAQLRRIQSMLDERTFATAWAAGRELDLDAALKLAHSIAARASEPAQAAPVPSPQPVTAGEKPAAAAELTAREIDVLRLLVSGLTYSQIAAQLVISPRTVDAHLRSIYSKLNVTSRAAAAHYAVEHGLI